jgi:hypothetical protein
MSVDSTQSGERIGRRRASQNEKGEKEYWRTFYVRCTTPTDGANDVLLWSGLPRMFDEYRLPNGEYNIAVWVTGREPQQIGPQDWEVEIHYSRPNKDKENKDENEKDNSTNPEDWTPKISVSWEQFQVVCTGAFVNPDAAGNAAFIQFDKGVLNSAGEAFDPPVMKDKCRPIVTIEDTVKQFDLTQAKKFGDAVNIQPFWGGAAKQWKCAGISTPGLASRVIQEVRIPYYPRVTELHFNAETWDLQVLDIGTFYWSGGAIGAGVKTAFKTADGQPFLGKLDGAGGALADAAADKFLTFSVQPTLNFDDLKLPANPFK